jgi:hypothetical protein
MNAATVRSSGRSHGRNLARCHKNDEANPLTARMATAVATAAPTAPRRGTSVAQAITLTASPRSAFRTSTRGRPKARIAKVLKPSSTSIVTPRARMRAGSTMPANRLPNSRWARGPGAAAISASAGAHKVSPHREVHLVRSSRSASFPRTRAVVIAGRAYPVRMANSVPMASAIPEIGAYAPAAARPWNPPRNVTSS